MSRVDWVGHFYIVLLVLIAAAFLLGFVIGRHTSPAGFRCHSNDIGAWCTRANLPASP